MAQLVNLDAMIKREDLTTLEGSVTSMASEGGVPASELAKGRLHYSLLRKPDFQRETNDWDVDNVVAFIKSFRDGHLIPALILWRSDHGYSFVIDGAHRLSALIAWVNDDYGDRAISREFFDHKIPQAQERTAKEVRARIASEIGTYSDLSKAASDENPDRERLKWASNISRSLVTQWVPGDVHMAETSFLAINQRAVQIKDPERYMILGRRKPHVIAARALVRSATGHKYWSRFDDAVKFQIESQAQKIYDLLFEPENADLSKTIEMPIAGHSYQATALRMALQLVSFSNGVRISRPVNEIDDDGDGQKTLEHLHKTYAVFKYVSGSGSASLGLHPAVYFWGETGSHHPSSLLAMVNFMRELVENDLLIEFSMHRAKFEEFIVTHGSVVKFILSKMGGWEKSVPGVVEMFGTIFNGYKEGLSDSQIEDRLKSSNRFNGLSHQLSLEASANKKITKETAKVVLRRELLRTAHRCSICHARLPSNAFSKDHIQRVEDGGRGTPDNIQLTHPYCNSGLKERLNHDGRPLPERPAFLLGGG